MQGQRIGYIRVSSFDQNPDRQLEHAKIGKPVITSGGAVFSVYQFVYILHLMKKISDAFLKHPSNYQMTDICQ